MGRIKASDIILTDNDPMPWGVHKDKKMANVPSGYLLGLYEDNKLSGAVKRYVEDNLDALKIDPALQRCPSCGKVLNGRRCFKCGFDYNLESEFNLY